MGELRCTLFQVFGEISSKKLLLICLKVLINWSQDQVAQNIREKSKNLKEKKKKFKNFKVSYTFSCVYGVSHSLRLKTTATSCDWEKKYHTFQLESSEFILFYCDFYLTLIILTYITVSCLIVCLTIVKKNYFKKFTDH